MSDSAKNTVSLFVAAIVAAALAAVLCARVGDPLGWLPPFYICEPISPATALCRLPSTSDDQP